MLRLPNLIRALKRHALVYTAAFVLLGGGTAYATHEAIYSSDIVDGEVKSVDIADNGVTGADIASNAVTGTDIASNAVTGTDIASNAVTGVDVKDNSLSGADIAENTLDLGCPPGVVHGFARVKGSADMETYWRSDAGVMDTVFNCTGGAVSVRRASTGVYFVSFDDNPARLAVANANTDGLAPDSYITDNIVSVAHSGPGEYRVETVDVNDSASGDTDPQDTWFTLMLL